MDERCGALPTAIAYFESNADELDPNVPLSEHIEYLDCIVRQYKSYEGERTYHIVGHTDSRGSVEYNFDLAERRAQGVKDRLVSEYGFDPSKLQVISYGDQYPVCGYGSSECDALNRRVEIHAIAP